MVCSNFFSQKRRALGVGVLTLACLGLAAPSLAAPRAVKCMTVVTFTYDDARYPKNDTVQAPDGHCDLSMHATPDGNYALSMFSPLIKPKEFKDLRKWSPEKHLQHMANMLSSGNSAAPVQDLEKVGVFSMAFSVARGPNGLTGSSYIATTWVGKTMLFVMLNHELLRNPTGPAYNRTAARTELLGILAALQIAPQPKK